MYVFITILIIIVSILLGIIVLIQNPKGGGLSGSFGGVGQQLLGARRSSDVIEKLTWGFAGALLLFCVLTTAFISKGSSTATTTTEKSAIEQIEAKKGLQPVAPAPAAQPQPGAAQPAAPANP